MFTDFDPYDVMCRMQEELQYLRQMNLKTMKNQQELAAAYNDLKRQCAEQAKLILEIKGKHNGLVEKHKKLEKTQWMMDVDREFETGRPLR